MSTKYFEITLDKHKFKSLLVFSMYEEDIDIL